METQGFEASADVQGWYVFQDRYGITALLEVVVGDTGTDMVNVMKADVAGYPLEKPGQFVVGSSLQRRADRVPLVVACPVDAFELMLDVEEPDTEGRADEQNRQLHQEIGLETDGKSGGNRNCHDHPVGKENTPDIPLTSPLRREPVPQQKVVSRAEAEHDQRIAVEPVPKPSPHRQDPVFRGSEGPDITDTAPVQITEADVMPGMGTPPVMKRGKGENPAEIPQVSVPTG